MNDVMDDRPARISSLADELRSNGSIGRSETVNRLFDFLLTQSLAGRSPKEVEVAQEVFGKDAGFDMAQDASVRVHIHRLRKKLDEVYAGSDGDRLTIPRGEYRLAVQTPEADPSVLPAQEPSLPDEPEPVAAPGWWRFVRRWRQAIGGAILGALVSLILGLLVWKGLSSRSEPLAQTRFWQPFAVSQRPTFLVTGDYYLFGEAADKARITRLLREFSINSRDDLDEYLMVHPEDHGRYVDLDLHYLPVSTGPAMRDILPLMNNLARMADAGRPWVVTMSRFAPEALRGSNLVYVGFLSGLGMLRDPLFEASGFSIGASYDELVDQASGKHYVSDWQPLTNGRSPRKDFAYLASFPGPSGNRILIVAGTRDAAVMQAAEIATDKAQLDQIQARAGNTTDFEALYEVRTLGTLNLGSILVLARPLKLDRLWRPGITAAHFPDQWSLPQPSISAAAKK